MLFTKRKRLRRRLRASSCVVHTFYSILPDPVPSALLFLFLLTYHFSLACGPGGGGGGGGGGGASGVSGRRKALSQAFDLNNVDETDGKLIWDIGQWVPKNFRAESDQAIISALNPNLKSEWGGVWGPGSWDLESWIQGPGSWGLGVLGPVWVWGLGSLRSWVLGPVLGSSLRPTS